MLVPAVRDAINMTQPAVAWWLRSNDLEVVGHWRTPDGRVLASILDDATCHVYDGPLPTAPHPVGATIRRKDVRRARPGCWLQEKGTAL